MATPIPTPVNVDVLIIGSGSAGLSAATWLSQEPAISFRILEKRDGPLQLGQADGVQCRTVEMYDSWGKAEELLRESYHCLELTFWAVDKDPSSPSSGRLVRTSRAADTPRGLSHLPHVLLSQARMNGLMIEKVVEHRPEFRVDYDHGVTNIEVTEEEQWPIRVTATCQGEERVLKAKYLLAADGAHSVVRRSLGIQMVGDSTDAVFGVMDVYPQTDFPDIRRKATIYGKDGKNLIVIPRGEGNGTMVRLYLQMPPGTSAKSVTLEQLHARAQSILSSFQLSFAATIWWSAYTIGQRLASQFSAGSSRIFLMGDAAHTHSPKAGQGMNVSLADGYNIGWKLAQVLAGKAPEDVLETYVTERQKVAAELIEFDRKLTALYHESETDPSAGERHREFFMRNQGYMAGLSLGYEESVITAISASDQSLAMNITVGMRFPSAKVVRWCDAKVVQLQKALPSDGRWRVVVFCGDLAHERQMHRLQGVAERLAAEDGVIRRLTAEGAAPDTFVEPLLVAAGRRVDLELDEIPKLFTPINGRYNMLDLYKVFFDDEAYDGTHDHAYDTYGIDASQGAVIVIRPDQHVSLIVGMEDVQGVEAFFTRLIPVHTR